MATNKGIDIAKFLMSFCVIAIHAPEYLYPADRTYPFLFNYIIRLAVPFFFIASGYFMTEKMSGMKDEEKRSYLKSRSKKLFLIWLYWTAIYLPLSFWGYSHSEILWGNYLEAFALSGHFMYAQPLWFIYSMAIITYIWALLIGWRHKEYYLVVIFAVITIASTFLSIDTSLKQFVTYVLGGGLPMFVGVIIYNSGWIKKYILPCCILILFISGCGMFYFHIPIGVTFGGAGLFILAHKLKISESINTLVLRKQSMWIYYIHMYFIIATMVICRHFCFDLNKYAMLTIICAISWLATYCLVYLGKSNTFKKINILIG